MPQQSDPAIMNTGTEFKRSPAFQVERFHNQHDRPVAEVGRFKMNLLVIFNDPFALELHAVLRTVHKAQGLEAPLYTLLSRLEEVQDIAAPVEEAITLDLNEPMGEMLLDILKRVHKVDGLHESVLELVNDLDETLHDGYVKQERKAS